MPAPSTRMISRSWVISEMLRPWAPSSPISRVETSSDSPAGSKVIRGARSERKITSSRTTMKSSEKDWTRLPVRCEFCWLATSVATWPARRSSSPAAGRTEASAAVSPSISVFCVAMSAGLTCAPHLDLERLLVGGEAEDTHQPDPRHLARRRDDLRERRLICGPERSMRAHRDDRHLAGPRHASEQRRSQCRRLRARRALGQKLAVVVVHLAAERRERCLRDDDRRDPGEHDQIAEADDDASQGGESSVHPTREPSRNGSVFRFLLESRHA